MMKNIFFTYMLWFFFGWLGLHHLYLGRDRQAFVWLTTFGGFFGVGWMRDLWRIPDYVDEANQEAYFMYSLRNKMKHRKKPSLNITRFAGEMMAGYFYGILAQLAIPEQVPTVVQGVIVCATTTMGVHIVGNIGCEKGAFKKPFLITMCTGFVLQTLFGPGGGFSYCVLACACSFNYYNEYDDALTNSPFCYRLGKLFVGCMLVMSLWFSFLYFNSTITIASTNEKIPLRDAIGHFFTSPAWLDFKETLSRLYKEGGNGSWGNAYDELVESIDPTGEKNAYKVLGISSSSSDDEIRTAYKKLVVKWHPDRAKEDDKSRYEKMFIKIQQAYELLSTRRKDFKQRKERSSHRKWTFKTDL